MPPVIATAATGIQTARQKISPVRTSVDVEALKKLFRAYAQSLDLDLSFQSFEREMSDMPGRYAVPAGGELLLARDTATNEPVGCVALRCLTTSKEFSSSTTTLKQDGNEHKATATSTNCDTSAFNHLKDQNPELTPASSPKIAEIKRLYTTPAARGSGLGRCLAEQIVQIARELGYDEIKLDTLPSMTAAQKLYRHLGFVDVEPYCFNPVADTKFMGLKLT